MPSPAAPNASDSPRTILAYRDRLLPRSELYFLSRLYVGFQRLHPLWIGRWPDDGLKDLNGEKAFLGRPGPLGNLERELFKQFGIIPSVPDLRARRPALVHAHFGRGGALALPLARGLNIPLVVSFYGADATKEKQYQKRLFQTVFQRRLEALKREAALFLCVSGFIRDQLIARGFPAEKLLVQHSGVNLDPEYGPVDPSQPLYVMFAGRFVEKKGVPSLIEAVRRLEAEGRTIRLILVGEGPMEAELRQSASALKQVEFHGWMPNHELRRWMRGALALCVPSQRASDGDQEGLPTVTIEAMAAGTPVIGSRHAGIHEAVDDGVTGFLIPEKSPDALADALRRLLDDPALRHRLGENARRAATERFDLIGQSRRLEDRLLAVIQNQPLR